MPEKFDVTPENEKNKVLSDNGKDIFARNDSVLDNLSFESEVPLFPASSNEDTSLGFDTLETVEEEKENNKKSGKNKKIRE